MQYIDRMLYVLEWRAVYAREGYFNVYFPSSTAAREIDTKVTQKLRHRSESSGHKDNTSSVDVVTILS